VEGEMKRDTWMQIVFYAAPRTRILARANGDVMNRIYLRSDTISRRGSETTRVPSKSIPPFTKEDSRQMMQMLSNTVKAIMPSVSFSTEESSARTRFTDLYSH